MTLTTTNPSRAPYPASSAPSRSATGCSASAAPTWRTSSAPLGGIVLRLVLLAAARECGGRRWVSRPSG